MMTFSPLKLRAGLDSQGMPQFHATSSAMRKWFVMRRRPARLCVWTTTVFRTTPDRPTRGESDSSTPQLRPEAHSADDPVRLTSATRAGLFASCEGIERLAQAGAGLMRNFGNSRVFAHQTERGFGVHHLHGTRAVAVVIHNHIAR